MNFSDTIKSSNILRGKMFISTRSKADSTEFINLFLSVGAEIIEFPMINILPARITNEKIETLRNSNDFQWIIFTSTNGVRHYFETLGKLNGSFRLSPDIRFAAIGEKTGEILAQYGYSPEFTGTMANSEGFSDQLISVIRHSNPKILIPTGNLTLGVLEKRLKGLAQVTTVEVYETTPPENIDKGVINRITSNLYEVIYFFSPSAVKNFIEIPEIKGNLNKIKAACIGPTTEKACLKMGITPLLRAEKPGSKNLFETTVNYYNTQNQSV